MNGVWRGWAALAAAGLGVAAAAGGVAFAEGVDVKPGLWRATSTASIAIAGEESARTETRETCVADGVLGPEALFNAEAGCRARNLELVGELMTFDMVCESGLSGPARFEGEEERGAGRVEMHGEIDGESVRMIVDMIAERVGDC